MLPTDTVYGVGVDAFDADGVQRLLDAKGRGRDMPPPVLISATTTLEALATELPGWARGLVEHYWPGPLTLVCRQQPSLRWDLGETRGTVAVRMPDDDGALDLLGRTGPLAVSSANVTGQPAATDADEAERMLGEAVEVVLDGGPSRGRGGLDHRRLHRRPPARAARGRDRRGRARATVLERPREPSSERRRPTTATPAPEPGDGPDRCVSTSWSSSWPASSATCSASSPARRPSARARWPGCATATSTPPRSRTSAGWRCSAASAPGCCVARHLPFLSTSQPFVFHDSGIVLIAGAMICAVGVLDDLIELDALTKLGGQVLAAGVHGAQRRAAVVAATCPASASSCWTRPRRRCSPCCWWSAR